MSGVDDLIAIVLTRNEAEHLPGCLTSLRPLTTRTLVLDSGSQDNTIEIARDAGAWVERRPFDGFANQRNAALELVAGCRPRPTWVLFIDADERLTPMLVAAIQRITRDTDETVAGFWLPRRNVVFGRTLRGGGWWPDYQARLLRLGRARYDSGRQVHEIVCFDGASRCLRSTLLHYNYATRREFIAKQRAFTAQRVAQERRTGFRPRRRAYLSMPVREIWRRFVLLRGYRDGPTGLFLAAILALEELRAVHALRQGGPA